MKILLDTHILLWTILNDPQLPETARKLIENEENEVYYSIVSPWEVEIKHLLHPDQLALSAEDLMEYCEESGFYRLSISAAHILNLHKLHRPEDAPPHRDPFDRMMICQAMEENMLFVTHDKLLVDYHEPCVFIV